MAIEETIAKYVKHDFFFSYQRKKNNTCISGPVIRFLDLMRKLSNNLLLSLSCNQNYFNYTFDAPMSSSSFLLFIYLFGIQFLKKFIWIKMVRRWELDNYPRLSA